MNVTMVQANEHRRRDGWVDATANQVPGHPPITDETYRGVWLTDWGVPVHVFAPDSLVPTLAEQGMRPAVGFEIPAPDSTPMLAAVTADLAALDVDVVPGGRTHKATALWLARVIDKRGEDEGPSTTAKLADQLTKVMQILTKRGDGGQGDDFGRLTDALSEPSTGG